MNALLLLRSHINVAYALGVVFLGALMFASLRVNAPDAASWLGPILFGWLGVALGRLAIGGGPSDRTELSARAQSPTTEKVDHLLRSIAKLIQAHLTDNEAFSRRLDGASAQLSAHKSSGPVNDIVLALIADNRDMREKLSSVRNQLEDSRLQVLQLKHSLVRSEEAGMRDVVTQIGNRRFFDTVFAEELEKARRTGETMCLAMADLDRFKLVNDRFGHVVGDRILRLFAEILVQNVRGQDRVARYGGEEFAVMFPGANLDEAIEALDRIRRVLESKQWTLEPSGERVGKITVSFGVAKLRANETGADLVQRVDGHLYEAKTKGRNCVVAETTEEAPKAPRRKRSLSAANG